MAIKSDTQNKLARALGDQPAAAEYTDAIDANTAKLAGEETIAAATITALTAGTINVSAMPTSDPSVAGALYSDGGTIKISSG